MVDHAFKETMNRLLETLDFTMGIQPEVTKTPDAVNPLPVDGSET